MCKIINKRDKSEEEEACSKYGIEKSDTMRSERDYKNTPHG